MALVARTRRRGCIIICLRGGRKKPFIISHDRDATHNKARVRQWPPVKMCISPGRLAFLLLRVGLRAASVTHHAPHLGQTKVYKPQPRCVRYHTTVQLRISINPTTQETPQWLLSSASWVQPLNFEISVERKVVKDLIWQNLQLADRLGPDGHRHGCFPAHAWTFLLRTQAVSLILLFLLNWRI